MAKKDYSKLNKEELLEVIKNLESKKKYGLVWDEEKVPEKVVVDCQHQLPVLKEVRDKEIITDPSQPTHILIEGDNYHALSVLNYTHKGKIDLIYIDPPYNTGNKDFVYNDCYVEKEDTWRHSKWLNFMNKRLELAKELLTEKGVIFISIDDNEVAQLKLLCDKVFGEECSLNPIIWHKKTQPSFLSKEIINVTEYILVYKRTKNIIPLKGGFTDKNKAIELINKPNQICKRVFKKENVDIGKGFSGKLIKGFYGNADLKVELIEDVNVDNGKPDKNLILNGRFKWSQNRIDETSEKCIISFKSITSLRPTLLIIDAEERIKPPISILSKYINDAPTNTDATNELKKMFNGSSPMDYPKPTSLIKRIIDFVAHDRKDAIVLDFFAGSGTTAQALLELNEEDGGNRKFIVCTNNENQLCEIVTLPRIYKVINGYKNLKEEQIEGLGGNLKYFKTSFVKNRPNKDQLKIEITKQCTEMLCLKEGIFNLKTTTKDYKIFEQNDRFMAVFYDFANASLDELKKQMNALKGEKILYCFTLLEKLETINFKGWKDIRLEPIPQKILDLYLEIFKN